jgi:hypothetical protein
MASAMRIKKVDVWAGDLRDQPGGLAQVLSTVAGGGASVECVIARRRESGGGVVFISPISGKRAQEAARSAGLRQADMGTLRIEGPDRPGLGSRITRAIADAGINMRGLTAAVLGGNFVCYIGFDTPADADRAARAIKGVQASGGRARRSTRSVKRVAKKKTTRSRR